MSAYDADDVWHNGMALVAEIQARSLVTSSTQKPAPLQAIKAITDKDEMLAAAERDKQGLRNLATTSNDELLQSWSSTLVEIFQIYQDQAASVPGKKPAPHYGIEFGNFKGTSCTATLLNVLQLLPEAYQEHVRVADQERAEANNKSWLSDYIMDVVVRLSCPLTSETIVFGRGIGTGFDESLDIHYKQKYSMLRLEYLIKQAQGSNSNLDEWNQGQAFTFPSTAKIIVFPWNYTGAHWIVVKLDIDLTSWKYTLYNSYNQGAKGPIWNSIVQQMPHLEKLICFASGFPRPLKESTFYVGDSPQQVNHYDCGIIAISNALTLLEGGEPTSASETDTNTLRWKYANLVLKYLQSLPSARHSNLPHAESAIPPGLSVESQATDTVDREAITAPLSSKISMVSQAEENPDEIALTIGASVFSQSEPPRLSQRVRKTIERYTSAPRQLSSHPQWSLAGLSNRQKVCFAELQGALSPETVSLLLELFLKSNKDDYPVLPANSRISVIPHDIWDGNRTRSKKQLIELFGDYLRAPNASPAASASTPEEAELATGKPPHIAFAPYSHQGSWVMIIFMSTSSSCRTEVYDPADCLADVKDWETVKRALREILRAVHGNNGEPVLWDCLECPIPKDLRPSKVSSGILAVEYAASWMKEYTEAILSERCFYQKYFKSARQDDMLGPKLQPVTYEETPLLEQRNVRVNAPRVKMAKILSYLHHNQQVVETSDDLSHEASEPESDESWDLGYTSECLSDPYVQSSDSESSYSSDSKSENDVARTAHINGYSTSQYFATVQDDTESDSSDSSDDDEENEDAADSFHESGDYDEFLQKQTEGPLGPLPEGFEKEIEQFVRTTGGKEASPERDLRDKARRAQLLTPDEIQSLLLTPKQVDEWLSMLGPIPERPKTSSK